MNVQYTARQAVLTPEIQAYCEKRLESLRSLAANLIDANIILSVEKSRNKAEIHVTGKNTNLVVCYETADMMTSLNQAFDYLEKQLRKGRARGRELKRRGGRDRRELAPPPEEPVPAPPATGPRVIPSAHFSKRPMDIDEALFELDDKNREVFVFRRENTEKWAVVYRRKDGNVGLVEPE